MNHTPVSLSRRRWAARCLPLALAALLLTPWPARSQDSGITREQADEILKELRQIRQMLEKGVVHVTTSPQPGSEQKAQLKLGDAPVLGKKDAPVTIVEFTDYQCTFCQRFHTVTFPELQRKYVDTGKVRFVTRDLPLEMHSKAEQAAEAARCAGEQGKFWDMRNILVANASKLGETDLVEYATKLSLAVPAFQTCLSSGKYREAVQKDMTEAAGLEISGTPSFVIGKTTPDGVEGVVVVGALPLPMFEAKLAQYGVK